MPSPETRSEIIQANMLNSAIIILIFLGSLATYTGYVIGQMKWKYPHISTMADAGEVLGGKWGREILGVAQTIFLIFVMASHLLTFTVAMNTITGHGTCSIVFGIVGMIVSFICSLPRTLVKMSWLSLVCMYIINFSIPKYQLTTSSIRKYHDRSPDCHDRRRHRETQRPH